MEKKSMAGGPCMLFAVLNAEFKITLLSLPFFGRNQSSHVLLRQPFSNIYTLLAEYENVSLDKSLNSVNNNFG